MLGKPKHGWTNVSIGDYSDQASYLDDVPLDCLNAFINGYSSYLPITISFDAEGHEFLLVVDYYTTHIISNRDFIMALRTGGEEKERFILKSYDINRDDLAKELINDIESNLEGWVHWFFADPFVDDDENSAERRKELIEHIEKLKELIRKSEQRADENLKFAMDFINSPKEIVEYSSKEELRAFLKRNEQ